MKLAANYEMQKDYAAAVVQYEKLIKDYPKSTEVAKAKKLKARASGLSKG
jgi:cytochrome c-type biogenesis protein CcmH/NrfG